METTTNKQVHLPSLVLWIMQRRCASIIKYGRGRSIKKFCEDEGYDYWKFCKLAREGQIDLNARSGEDKPGFVEVKPDGAVAQVVPEEPMKVCEIRIRFNNGLVLSRRGGDVEEVISAIRKILS